MSGWKIYRPDALPYLARTYAACHELYDAVIDRRDRLERNNHDIHGWTYRISPYPLYSKIYFDFYLDIRQYGYDFIMPDIAKSMIETAKNKPYIWLAGDDETSVTIAKNWERYTTERKYPKDFKLFTLAGSVVNDARKLHADYRLINDMVYVFDHVHSTGSISVKTWWLNTGVDIEAVYGDSPTTGFYDFNAARKNGDTCYVNLCDLVLARQGGGSHLDYIILSIPVTPTPEQTADTTEALESFVASVRATAYSAYFQCPERTWESSGPAADYRYDGGRFYTYIRSTLKNVLVEVSRDDSICISNITGLVIHLYIVESFYENDEWHRVVIFDGDVNDKTIPEIEINPQKSIYITINYSTPDGNIFATPYKLDTPYYHEPVNAPRPTSP